MQGHIEAEHAHRARAWLGHAVQHAERRRLARAIRAQEAKAKTPSDIEVERVHGEPVAKALGHGSQLSHGGGRKVETSLRGGHLKASLACDSRALLRQQGAKRA